MRLRVESCGRREGMIWGGVAGEWLPGLCEWGTCQFGGMLSPQLLFSRARLEGVTHICDGLGKLGLLPLKPCASSCPW